MFSKSFLSVMIVTSAFTLIFGQTPDAKKEKGETPQTFAFSFDSEGSYLGIEMQEINKENFAKFGLAGVRGVAVVKVVENSPAAAAGIKNGDVIVRFNGEEIASARKLTRLVGEIDPDHQVADLFHKAHGTPLKTGIEELCLEARGVLRQHYLTADMGISGGNFFVAETGSVVVVTNEGNATLTTRTPKGFPWESISQRPIHTTRNN